MQTSWGIGMLVIQFRGSSQLAVKMHSGYSDGLYYTCKINDGTDGTDIKLFHPNTEEYLTIATNLDPSKVHEARCGRNNEASWGLLSVYGALLDEGGELLHLDPNSDDGMLRLEYVGDSITNGFKVTADSAYEPATVHNQDVFLAYPRFLSDAFKSTDYHVIAKSGVSILDYGTTGVVMPLEYPCRQFWSEWEGGCPSYWDFSSWQADVVLVNLGTNDFAFGGAAFTFQQFRQGYLGFLQDIRAKNPNALIACIQPLQYSCGGGDPTLASIVNGLAQAVADMSDQKVILYETGSPRDPWLECATDYIDYTHPTVEGNVKFATKLYDAMIGDVCRFFPNKCGADGPTSAPVPTSKPTLKPTAAILTSPPTIGSTSCIAVEQSALPEGTWATTDAECSKCSDGYQWWPCNMNPALCNCSIESPKPTPSLFASPSAAPTSDPKSSPSTAKPTLAPELQPSYSGLTCTAVPQSELPENQWATTDYHCRFCEQGRTWWPCNVEEPAPICKCVLNPYE